MTITTTTTTISSLHFHTKYNYLIQPYILYGLPIMYVMTVMSLTRLMRYYNIQPISNTIIKPVMQCYNIVQIVVCAYMVYGLLHYPNIFAISTPRSSNIEYFVLIHYLSKYLDWLDTIFMCLRRKDKQISFLQVYHHATISIVWGYVLSIGWGSGVVSYGAMINSVTHVLMYSHYFFASLGYKNPLKKYLTMFQIGQFWSCQFHAWIVAFGTYQTTFTMFHETIYPIHLAYIQVIYHVTMIYLFTFKLHWAPNWITGRPSNTAAAAAKEEEEDSKNMNKMMKKNKKKNMEITMKELAKHNKYNDSWLLIHNNVYDVTEWSKTHPGGDIILLGGGTDSTAMFEMYHPKGVHNAILEKYCIGTIVLKQYLTSKTAEATTKIEEETSPSYYNWENEIFYKTMKTRVVQRLNEVTQNGTWHDSPIMYLKTCFILLNWSVSLYFVTFHGSYIAAITLGIFSSLIGTCIMHDGCHGAYSSKSYINVLMGFGMDLIGASTYCWEAHHNTGHHPFTNLITREENEEQDATMTTTTQENDPDVFSSYPLIRMNPFDDWKPHHQYQWLYSPIAFGGFTMLKVLYNDIVQVFVDGKVNDFISMKPRLSNNMNYCRILFMKLASLGYMLIAPIYFNGIGQGLVLFTIAHFFCGLILATMFIVTHITDSCEFMCNNDTRNANERKQKLDEDDDALKYNWAAAQCRTSTNWALKSTFWTHFSGGLNHQIEHHLFPSISHVYYPYIQDVVEDTCKEFNVQYKTHDTLFDALYHTLHWLWLLGIDPNDDGEHGRNVINNLKTSGKKVVKKIINPKKRRKITASVVKKCDTIMHHT